MLFKLQPNTLTVLTNGCCITFKNFTLEADVYRHLDRSGMETIHDTIEDFLEDQQIDSSNAVWMMA